MSDTALVAPQPHELDVVVFGPGVGESILLHLGESDWFVIDSCKYPGEKTPAALKYLPSIGVDPSVSVKRILATHWHDDHIKGLAISYLVAGRGTESVASSRARPCDRRGCVSSRDDRFLFIPTPFR